jgi:hypothetical protein
MLLYAPPLGLISASEPWRATIGVTTGTCLQKRCKAGWRNPFIKPALQRFYSMFSKS